jgi:diacylglycerol kinase family enzyme
VRALLIVNPRATSTTGLRRDVIARALASAVELTVVETRYRGHATRLAADAVRDGHGLVLTLGGDGTANEAINGIVGAGAGAAGGGGTEAGTGAGAGGADKLPALAPLPGGSANVLGRALGLPADPIDAAGRVLLGLAEGRERSIGLGLAGGRYFAFNAGFGFDAEVVRAVEALRAGGRTATPALYMRTAFRQYYQVTDRRHPALTLESDDGPDPSRLFLAIVSNTTPWTYVGARPVQTSPKAGFDTGLDLLALRSMRTPGTFRALATMLAAGDRAPAGRHIVSLHDQARLLIKAERPVAFQVDGEYMGEHESVLFEAIPDAIRVIT